MEGLKTEWFVRLQRATRAAAVCEGRARRTNLASFRHPK